MYVFTDSPQFTSSSLDKDKGGQVSPHAIPDPTHQPPDVTKKSHAKKQPLGHIPRPRNAFILFRCDFVRQRKVPTDIESNHQTISKIAGVIWNKMSKSEKAPWLQMALKEKIEHNMKYPGYRYSSNGRPAKRRRGPLRQQDDAFEEYISFSPSPASHASEIASDEPLKHPTVQQQPEDFAGPSVFSDSFRPPSVLSYRSPSPETLPEVEAPLVVPSVGAHEALDSSSVDSIKTYYSPYDGHGPDFAGFSHWHHPHNLTQKGVRPARLELSWLGLDTNHSCAPHSPPGVYSRDTIAHGDRNLPRFTDLFPDMHSENVPLTNRHIEGGSAGPSTERYASIHQAILP